MDSLLLQDWVTILNGGGLTVTQSEATWLDLSAYDDAVFYFDVKQAASAAMAIQTSPSRNEESFQILVPSFTMAATTSGPLVKLALAEYAWPPIARFVRWQITGEGTATFRIWALAYCLGV